MFVESNRAYDELISLRPPLIVGRRGSGKTSLLRALANNDATFSVELNTGELLAAASHAIRALREMDLLVLEDQAAEVWHFIYINSLIRRTLLVHSSNIPNDDRAIMMDYTAHEILPERDPEDFAKVALRKLIAVKGESPGGIKSLTDHIEETEVNEVPFLLAREALFSSVASLELDTWVLIDSVEAFMNLGNQRGTGHTALALPLAGLFQSISRIDENPRSPFKVRLSFPAEVYHTYVDFSLNPIRDFSRQVRLHWSPGELLEIAARRLRIYYQIHGQVDRIVSATGSSRQARRAADREMLLTVLPTMVTNGNDGQEHIFPYLIRHTQLTPRHLISILNRILALTIGQHESLDRPASNAHVVQGVQDAESQMVTEIISAYKPTHPSARQALECVLPQLPTEFSEQELSDVHRMHGRGIIREFDDFRRMAIEVGCVGEVIKSTQALHEARFEYHLPHRLNVPEGAGVRMAIHPIFSKVIGSVGSKGLAVEGQLPVYPQGWNPDELSNE